MFSSLAFSSLDWMVLKALGKSKNMTGQWCWIYPWNKEMIADPNMGLMWEL